MEEQVYKASSTLATTVAENGDYRGSNLWQFASLTPHRALPGSYLGGWPSEGVTHLGMQPVT